MTSSPDHSSAPVDGPRIVAFGGTGNPPGAKEELSPVEAVHHVARLEKNEKEERGDQNDGTPAARLDCNLNSRLADI